MKPVTIIEIITDIITIINLINTRSKDTMIENMVF